MVIFECVKQERFPKRHQEDILKKMSSKSSEEASQMGEAEINSNFALNFGQIPMRIMEQTIYGF